MYRLIAALLLVLLTRPACGRWDPAQSRASGSPGILSSLGGGSPFAVVACPALHISATCWATCDAPLRALRGGSGAVVPAANEGPEMLPEWGDKNLPPNFESWATADYVG
jgi:hypothetical protein